MIDALFDLPAPPKAPRAPERQSQVRKPALPLGCRSCSRPLTDWCASIDALPETGSWGSADRIIDAVMAERARRTP